MIYVARVVLIAVALILAVAVYKRIKIAAAGLTVTSWFRTPWHNDEVGGVVNSRHQLGLAFDIVPVNSATEAALKRIGFNFILNEGDHYHVEVA